MPRPYRLLSMAPIALLVALAAPAWAEGRLVITAFTNDDGGRIQDQIADELLFRNPSYQVVPYERFLDEVDSYGMSVDEFLEDAGLIADAAERLQYDAILHGALDRAQRPRSLTLEVYDGGSGLSLGTVDVPVTRGQVADADLDDAMFQVGALIDQARGPAAAPAPEPVAQPAPRPAAQPATAAPTMDLTSREQRPSNAGWFRITGGLDMVQRNFTLNAADAGIQYESGFYPGVEGALEVYPLRLFSPGTLDGLGLRFRVAHYFVDTVLTLDAVNGDLNIPTRHKELGISLLYRHTLGRFELLGSVGYEHLAFTLGDNPVYESSEYSGLAIAINAFYAALPDLLRVGLGFEIRPAPSLGDAETAAFGSGSAFGFAFRAGVEVTPLPQLLVAAFYGFRQYSDSFDGTGTSDLTGNLDATDTFQQIGLRVGYVY